MVGGGTLLLNDGFGIIDSLVTEPGFTQPLLAVLKTSIDINTHPKISIQKLKHKYQVQDHSYFEFNVQKQHFGFNVQNYEDNVKTFNCAKLRYAGRMTNEQGKNNLGKFPKTTICI